MSLTSSCHFESALELLCFQESQQSYIDHTPTILRFASRVLHEHEGVAMSSSTTPVGNHAESHNAAIPGTTATGHQGAGLDSLLPKAAGGAPARIYLNEKIVPYLLEGMKNLAREQPSNPLKVLGEFLIQKSNEIEEVQNNGH